MSDGVPPIKVPIMTKNVAFRLLALGKCLIYIRQMRLILAFFLGFFGFFCVFSIFRVWSPEMFINAHRALDVVMGGTNTVVLITSSLTMALAIRYIQMNNNKAAIINLLLTLMCKSHNF